MKTKNSLLIDVAVPGDYYKVKRNFLIKFEMYTDFRTEVAGIWNVQSTVVTYQKGVLFQNRNKGQYPIA